MRGPGPFRPTSTAMRAVRPSAQFQVFPYRDTLVRSLGRHMGSNQEAERFVRDVLDDAGLSAVPEGREAFVAFVREEILPRLMPSLRLEQLHDVVRRTIGAEEETQPAPLKASGAVPGARIDRGVRPRVAVVEPDRARRVDLSRALVRAGFDVEAIADVGDLLHTDAFHVAILALDKPEALEVVEALAKKKLRSGIVTYDDPASRAAIRRTIECWPTDRVAIVPKDASPATLCARVRIVIE